MKSVRNISVLFTMIFLLAAFSSNAQKVVVEKRHHNKVVKVCKGHKHYRKGVVYHPVWSPRIAYTHRWVFFPRYNFYWDNWNEVYIVRNETIWVSSKILPKEVENLDLQKENKVELGEENDDLDTIQEKNSDHRVQYIANK